MLDVQRLRRFWRRRHLSGLDDASDHDRRFDALYRLKNPWGFNDPQEQIRFTETNRILLREFGRVGTLLELGCAEGHQTIHLMRACQQLYGLDISARAISRAKRKCPGAIFTVGDLTSTGRFANAPDRFDLVVACEVLYYVPDVSGTLRLMGELGRACLVTYYEMHREQVEQELAAIDLDGREAIRSKDLLWSVVWWRT
jgi:2-polyprenyl-3-methyl-5-hydroxy-6-metoxy-1,4-benzoquinol methylase